MKTPFTLTAGVLLCCTGLAQDKPYTISVQADEVRLSFSVTDYNGRPVTDIQQADVSLKDNGKKPSRIVSFKQLDDMSLRAGLLIDTSSSAVWGSDALAKGRWTATLFAVEIMRPERDSVFVSGFDSQYKLKQQWTNERMQVMTGVRDVAKDSSTRLGGTGLFDALYTACRDQFQDDGGGEERATNVLFVFSDELDNASHALPQDVAEMCQQRHTIINVMSTESSKGQKTMRDLAAMTGGQMLYGNTTAELERELRKVELILRSRYLLTYQPDKLKRDGSFHKIRLESAKRGGVVTTRSGYYANTYLPDSQGRHLSVAILQLGMNESKIIPLYDPKHQPSSWNERMLQGEFAVLFTGEHPETVNGVQTPDGAFCVLFCDLKSAAAYAEQAVIEYPKMICKIYDHRGMVGAPSREFAGAQANKGEISRKFRLWAGGCLTGIGIVLGAAEIASGFKLNWAGMLGSRIGPVGAILLLTEAALSLGAARERKTNEGGMNGLLLLCAQLVVVLSATFACGWIAKKLGQPRVIGEIAGGILLGPVVMGQVMPQISAALFATSKLHWLEWVSNAGLVAFLFLIGSELDLNDEKRSAKTVIATTAGSILLPFALGAAIAPPLLQQYGAPQASGWGFVLFIAVAMSITALPVLARILKDREGAGKPVAPEIAQHSLISAALNDALAWCVLAAMLAVLHGGGAQQVLVRLSLLLAFVAAMFAVVRPLLRKFSLPAAAWLALFIAVAAGSAWVTNALGIHLFFGAFLAGVCAPRGVLSEGLQQVVRTFSAWTLPAFFALTGLRMRPELFHSGGWMWLVWVLAVAVFGKIGGASLAARATGVAWPAAWKIGILLNTRGLVELIVLNAGYREGILNAPVFTLLVCMAVITTAMTGPLLDVFD